MRERAEGVEGWEQRTSALGRSQSIWQPGEFKISFANERVLKCSHRDGPERCEEWATWRVPPPLALCGDLGTRYYCNAHVPDLPTHRES